MKKTGGTWDEREGLGWGVWNKSSVIRVGPQSATQATL